MKDWELEGQDEKGSQKNDARILHMCGRKKEIHARYWILKEEVDGVVDMQTDCVHNDHNSDNAPRRGKTVEDCYRGNNPRKHVLLHRM